MPTRVQRNHGTAVSGRTLPTPHKELGVGTGTVEIVGDVVRARAWVIGLVDLFPGIRCDSIEAAKIGRQRGVAPVK